MNLSMAQRILGLMLMVFSLTMLPPILVSFIYGDGHWQPFLMSSAIIAAAGFLLWLPSRNARRELRLRDGFLIVSVFWVFLGLAGATPLFLSDVPELSFTDSVFEAVSGFTTTGARIMSRVSSGRASVASTICEIVIAASFCSGWSGQYGSPTRAKSSRR